MMREFTETQMDEMRKLAQASPIALELQTKKNQQLQHTIAQMQKSIDVLTDQRTTAEGQIKRLLDLLERTQAQRDAAQAELNRTLAVVNAARVLCDELYPDRTGNDGHCGCIQCTLVTAIETFDAQRETKP